jgi:predicted RNA binding protein YcfA (HicA-like mRNA interferase family)
MPKLKVFSGKSIIKILSSFGFVTVRIVGSHVRMKLNKISITIPLHKEIKRKILLEIYRVLEKEIEKNILDDIFYNK